MQEPIHIAITRRVRSTHTVEFEHALADFAMRSLAEPGTTGVHRIYPVPGSGSSEYGIIRSFAHESDRDAFYESPLYRDWMERIAPMVDGAPAYRRVDGLDAWFRHPDGPAPPRWKMALLTWSAVWPISMIVPAIVVPALGGLLPQPITAGLVAAGIVVALTWGAMPVLVKAAHSWLHPKDDTK